MKAGEHRAYVWSGGVIAATLLSLALVGSAAALGVLGGQHRQAAPVQHALAAPRLRPPARALDYRCDTLTRIGTSRGGRAIHLERFGRGARRVLVVGGVHGNEYGSGVAAELATYLAQHPEAVPPHTTVDVVPCACPDGLAIGRRTNAEKVDINRNFPVMWRPFGAKPDETPGPRAASEPETRALMRLLAERHYSAVISLHSVGGLLDYDGPGGDKLARRIAGKTGLRVRHFAETPGVVPYYGTMGQFVAERHRIPLVTWELGVKRLSPKTLTGLTEAMR
jgi:protein MpaA